MDDDDLAARLADDLDGSFEPLVLAHQDRLYSIALRLTGDGRDAEEVAQDAFVRAYRALATYPAERVRTLHLRPWLATITINLARNRRRRAADRQPPVSMEHIAIAGGSRLDLVAPETDRPDAAHQRRATTERWAALVAALPERYRVPIVLRHIDDLSYTEMAAVLGRPEGTLKAQVHRGLALLHAAVAGTDHEELTA